MAMRRKLVPSWRLMSYERLYELMHKSCCDISMRPNVRKALKDRVLRELQRRAYAKMGVVSIARKNV